MIRREMAFLAALHIKPQTAKFFHPRLSLVPSISNLKLTFIIAWVFMAFGLTCLSQPVQGAAYDPETHTLPPGLTVNFQEAVKIALQQSPYLKKSGLEIKIKRMDETDSRYSMIPPLTFQTYYYVNRPTGIGGTPYSLSFSTQPYNPVVSYFTLQGQKMATQVAILAHLKTISMGLQRLGQLFLELDSYKNQAANQKDSINLSREKLTFAQNRLKAGTGTSLEVKEAQQGLEIAKNQLQLITIFQKRALSSLKGFLGLKPNQELNLDLHDTRRQVMGDFNPDTFTWEQAKSLSYDLKMEDIKLKLQGYNINLAIANAFPTILFTTQTPDPLSNTDLHGLYVGFGLQIPVWDGFKRIRNISRQKAVLQQYGSEKDMIVNNLKDKFLTARTKVKDAGFALQAAQSSVELAQLQVRQKEISYHSGGIPLSEFLESRIKVWEAKRKLGTSTLDYERAVLALRQISGDLGHSYVHATSFQN